MPRLKQITIILFFSFVIVSTIFSEENTLQIINGEKIVLERTGKDGEIYYATIIYYVEDIEGVTTYSYFYSDMYATWQVWTDTNSRPFKIIYGDEDGNAMTFLFNHEGEVILKGKWKNKDVEKVEYFPPDDTFVTLEINLVIRTLDLESDEKFEFDLLQANKFPRLVASRMYFQVVGEEKVKVQAGTFDCKKVLFSLSDWRGLFWQAYYYITNDRHRYIVKIINIPNGGETELVEIE